MKNSTKLTTTLSRLAKVLNDQEIPCNNLTRTIGTIFIALSGLILYLDKAMPFLGIENKELEFNTLYDSIWIFSQCIVPFFLVIGVKLRSYILGYLILVYCFSLQLVFLLSDGYYFEREMIVPYSIGIALITVVLFFFTLKGVRYLNNIVHKREGRLAMFILKSREDHYKELAAKAIKSGANVEEELDRYDEAVFNELNKLVKNHE